MKLVCIGDSNTWGYDPRSIIGGRYDLKKRWTGILKGNGYEVINLGVNGMCVPDEWDADGLIKVIKREADTDLLIVMLGTNDILQNCTAEDTAKRMNAFLARLKNETELPVLLLCPPVVQAGEWVSGPEVVRESQRLAGLYRIIAEQNDCRFADTSEWDIETGFDGVHFTETGHSSFAKGILNVLEAE